MDLKKENKRTLGKIFTIELQTLPTSDSLKQAKSQPNPPFKVVALGMKIFQPRTSIWCFKDKAAKFYIK